MRPIAIAFQDEELSLLARLCLVDAGIPDGDIEIKTLRSVDEVLRWLAIDHPQLLVIDALLSRRVKKADPSGRTVLELLNNRASCCGRLVPTMVITQSRNPASELESYCTPLNEAIAMPITNLHPGRRAVFNGVLGMIGPNRKATWTVIEIQVRDRYCKCFLGDRDGNNVDWDENRTIATILRTAQKFDSPAAFKAPWQERFDAAGRELFDQHVFGTLGKAMFSHIEHNAGGLSSLAFRFQIFDTQLYAVPFEASIRPIDEDPNKSEFVLLKAPLARWLPTSGAVKVGSTRSGKLPQCLRVIFIRSQMSEHPEGETHSDSLDVGDGRILEFRKLQNIDVEYENLSQLAADLGPERLIVEKLDLNGCDEVQAIEKMRNAIKESHDIVHFAGHSWSSSTGPTARTVLVLPGRRFGHASKMKIDVFAEIAGQSKARLVYLSSCQGSSARSVLSLAQYGVQHAVGFRCDVEDDKAASFAAEFYRSLFESSSISRAFRAACSNAQERLLEGDPSPIWASPILVAQTVDWAV